MVEFLLHLLFGMGWMSWIASVVFVMVGLSIKVFIERRFGKGRFKLFAVGAVLVFIGSLFITVPINHTFRCSHTEDSCLRTSRDILGAVKVEQSFKLSEVSEVYIDEVVTRNRQVESTYYWLMVKAGGKEHRIDSARSVENLPYEVFKGFIENKNSPDYRDSKGTKNGFYLGFGALLLGVILAGMALVWPRQEDALQQIKEFLSEWIPKIFCIGYFLGVLFFTLLALWNMRASIIVEPARAIKVVSLGISALFVPAYGLFLLSLPSFLFYLVLGWWKEPQNPIRKLFRVLFFNSKETEAALAILEEDSLDYGSAQFLKNILKQAIFENRHKFAVSVHKDGRSVRKHVYSMIANLAANMVESGQYHLYRGVLNPTGPGSDLLRLYDMAIDELVKLGDADENWAAEQKAGIRNNMKQVG